MVNLTYPTINTSTNTSTNMRLLFYFVISICITPIFAEESQNLYRAVYSFDYIRDSINNTYSNDIINLDLSQEGSFCYSQYSWELDSLLLAPHGYKLYRALIANAIKKEGPLSISYPHRRSKFMIQKKYNQPYILVQNWLDGEYYQYDDKKSDFIWEITDNTDTIKGYPVVQATCLYHGRKWNAWFTTELPWSDGPWKFTGLPGLIIKITDSSGLYLFELQSIYSTKNIKSPWIKECKITTRMKFNKAEYEYYTRSDNGMLFHNIDQSKFKERMYRIGLETDYER